MDNFQVVKFDTGELVFSHDDIGQHAYLIRSGKVTLYKDVDGTKQVIADMNPGQILGEMALFTGNPRSATAEVLEPSELLVIDRETFEILLQKSTPFIKGLINQLINRIQSTENNNQCGDSDSSLCHDSQFETC